MPISLVLLAAITLAGASQGAAPPAKVRVVTTLPDLGSIAREVGGNRVEVVSLARGYEDPHYVTPTPSLMREVNRADLFVEVGLSLEIWTERVLDGAGNPGVRPGAPGHVYASDGVPRKEIPKVVTRAEGDLHPEGNPHIWLDPLLAKRIARNIADGLARVRPDAAGEFEEGYRAFARRIDEALFGRDLIEEVFKGKADLLIRLLEKGTLFPFLEEKEHPKGRKLIRRLGGWLGAAESLRGKKIVFFHQSWVYFADRFGLEIAGYVEEKPGIAPSARHRDEIVRLIREEGIRAIAIAPYYDDSIPRAIARETGCAVVVLPTITGGVKEATDYFTLLDTIIGRLGEVYGER